MHEIPDVIPVYQCGGGGLRAEAAGTSKCGNQNREGFHWVCSGFFGSNPE
jgi:hypothetical protein